MSIAPACATRTAIITIIAKDMSMTPRVLNSCLTMKSIFGLTFHLLINSYEMTGYITRENVENILLFFSNAMVRARNLAGT